MRNNQPMLNLALQLYAPKGISQSALIIVGGVVVLLISAALRSMA